MNKLFLIFMLTGAGIIIATSIDFSSPAPQTLPQTPPQSLPTPAPQTPPRNEYKETLQKMFVASGDSENYKILVTETIKIYKLQPNYSRIPIDVWSDIEAEMLSVSSDELIDILTPAYSKYLNLKDLQEIITFYQSPVGKKFAQSKPAITKESMTAAQTWGLKIYAKISEKLKNPSSTTPSPAPSTYKETLQKMFVASSDSKTHQLLLPEIIQNYKQQPAYSDVPQNVWADLENDLSAPAMDELIEMLAAVYSKYLTIQDLQAIIGFYQSPAGQKLTQNTPLIAQETTNEIQIWAQKLATKIQTKLNDKGY